MGSTGKLEARAGAEQLPGVFEAALAGHHRRLQHRDVQHNQQRHRVEGQVCTVIMDGFNTETSNITNNATEWKVRYVKRS